MKAATVRSSDEGPAMSVPELRRQETVLLGRLRSGEEKIEIARARGENVDRWEEHWIGLLKQYERVYDLLQAS